MASAARGMGHCRRAPAEPPVEWRDVEHEEVGVARLSSPTATSVLATLRVSGKRNDDYMGTFVFDNDHPCVGSTRRSRSRRPTGIYRNRPAHRHSARRLLQPTPRPDAGRTRSRRDRQSVARLAGSVRRTRRATRRSIMC